MISIKSAVVNSWLLIGILTYCGWRLYEDFRVLRSQPARLQAIAAKDQDTVFQAEAGVDAWGHIVSPLPKDRATRTVVFMVHGATASDDLEFWNKVDEHLAISDRIRLVGYCDGDKCSNTVRLNNDAARYPIIAYGEISGAQALINADSAGRAVVRSDQYNNPKYVTWRDASATPAKIASELHQ